MVQVMTMATVHMEKAKLYASSEKMSVIMNTCVHAPTMSRLSCGAFLAFILPQEAGSSWRFAMSDVVSAGRMVNDSHEPSTEMMMAMEMNAPPQPGAIESNTYSMAG